MDVTDEIKARIDVVDYINSFVQLKKAGKNYKGLCPFHGEKTPSFVVFPETNTWRCFGCGRGGDVFNFAMEHEGWDFRTALEELARRAGVELEPLTPEKQEEIETEERLLGLLAEAAGFYLDYLLHHEDAAHAREYIDGRGLTAETVATFEIGFAPDGWQTTSDYLKTMGYTDDDLIAAGLLVQNDRGHTYDRFRNRVVIPIRNAKGDIVGFGARTLDPDGKPKYLNSPQNRIFDKSSLLYGFSLARRSIRETETVVIVEGYMDVVQAHQAGFTNAVAQMGTALTESQLKLLARYASRIILALDADAAGQMATDRGLEAIERVSDEAARQATEEGTWGFDSAEKNLRARRTMEFDASGMVRVENDLGFDIRIIIMPEGRDPDDIIRYDPDYWIELVDDSIPIVEYAIQRAVEGRDTNDPKVKSTIVKEITPLINNIADAVERTYYRQKLARLLRISETALQLERPAAAPQKHRRQQTEDVPHPETTPTSFVSPTTSRELFALAALLREHRLIYRVNRLLSQYLTLDGSLSDEHYALAQERLGEALARRISPYDFQNIVHRTIFVGWEEALNQDEMERIDYLRQRLDPNSWAVAQRWLERPLDSLREGILPIEGRLRENDVFEAVVYAVLYLRRRVLEAHQQELVLLLEDMDNGGNKTALLDHLVVVNAIRAAQQKIIQAEQHLSNKLETHT